MSQDLPKNLKRIPQLMVILALVCFIFSFFHYYSLLPTWFFLRPLPPEYYFNFLMIWLILGISLSALAYYLYNYILPMYTPSDLQENKNT
ncbi:MAG: hypothetical protein ACFFC7_15385 [Candidatus Hermodarchaeota archaeon]